MEYTLTALDTASIQSYIFGSNELRENIGASHLVYLATTAWVQAMLNEVVPNRHNYRVQQNEARPYHPSFRIEEQGELPCAEVMYAGGGNTFILFRGESSKTIAKDFVYRLSTKIIEEAPGLNLYAAHQSFAWGDNLPAKVDEVLKALTRLKNQMPVYMPTLGLSVTAACASTGLPANHIHPDPDKNGKNNNGRPTLANRANRQVWGQWQAAKGATDRLRDMFNFVDENKYRWTDNLDKIGKLPKRDESFIAVVHADGNGMGKQMIKLSEFFRDNYAQETRAYITAVRALSLSYNDTAQSALKCTLRDLVHSLDYHENHVDGDGEKYYGRANNDNGVMTSYLPFRPIVFGGDDVTWVCAGPWGIAMAHRYLTYLEEQTLPTADDLLEEWQPDNTQDKQKVVASLKQQDLAKKPYACAGVSIVKTHYPISRAYDNSEALLGSAKAQVYVYDRKKQGSAIDWHMTTTGLAGDLGEIRQREYETIQPDYVAEQVLKTPVMHKLTMRPLLLNNEHTWRNWQNFHYIYEQFDLGWFTTRNKMMALREAVRNGPKAVAEFKHLERKGTRLPTLPHPPQVEIGDVVIPLAFENGWVDYANEQIEQLTNLPNKQGKKQAVNQIRCAYFDAIEIEDQLLTLVRHAEKCEELS